MPRCRSAAVCLLLAAAAFSSGAFAQDAVTPDRGGTGMTSYNFGDVIFASGAITLGVVPIGSVGQCFQVLAGPTLGYGSCGTGGGGVTQVACGTGLSCSPSPIVTTGTASLTVPVTTANGGTNATSWTLGSVPFLLSGTQFSEDNANFFWDHSKLGLGLGTASLATGTRLSVAGGRLQMPATSVTLANGQNNDIAVAGSYANITGPTTNFAITGFTGGADGQMLFVFNSSSGVMVIGNQRGSASANQILTMQGTDVAFKSGRTAAFFVYDGAASKWILAWTAPQAQVQVNQTAGATGAISSGALTTAAIATPSLSVSNQGTPGTTHYTYEIAAVYGYQLSASGAIQTTTGAATLNGTNFNRITITPVANAAAYNIYRTASSGTPSSTGLIGTATAEATTFDDTGLAGDNKTPPVASSNTTGNIGVLERNPQVGIATANGQTIGQEMSAPTSLALSTSTVGGSLAAGTYYYEVTAKDIEGGETIASSEVSITTTGATSTITATWNVDIPATEYRIYRGQSSGTEQQILTGTISNNAYLDTGALAASGPSPPLTTSAFVNRISSNGGTRLYAIGVNAGEASAIRALTDMRGSSVVTGTLQIEPNATPGPTVTPVGTTGATTYTYYVCAIDGSGAQSCSPTVSTTTGNATLSSTNYNLIQWALDPGAIGYTVYKTAGPGAQGSVSGIGVNTLYLKDTVGTGVTAGPGASFSNSGWLKVNGSTTFPSGSGPSFPLDVGGEVGITIDGNTGNVGPDGLLLQNTTASNALATKETPPWVHWTGHVWNTGGTPADNATNLACGPQQTSGNPPTFQFSCFYQLGGGTNNREWFVDNSGNANFSGTGTFGGAISAASAALTAGLTVGAAITGMTNVTGSGNFMLATSPTSVTEILNHPTIGISGTATSAHISTVGTAPGCTFSTGGGTSPSCALATGSTDAAGIINLTTGSGTPGSTGTVTLTFNSTYSTNVPVIVLTGTKGSTGSWATCANFQVTTTSLTAPVITWTNGVCTSTTPTALSTATVYSIAYVVIGKT